MQKSINNFIDESFLNLYYTNYDPFFNLSDDYFLKDKDNNDREFLKSLFYYNNDEKSTGENGNIKNDNKKKRNKKLGRKTKGEKRNENEHNKYTFDNMLRKSKRMIINELFHYINKKIADLYEGKIGKGTDKKKLHLLNYEQIQNAKIDFNKAFKDKTLREILSVEPSKRVNNCKKNHNKILIEELTKEDNQDKKDYFNGFFNLTFLDCLKYFRGEHNSEYEYIEGLNRFDDLVKDDEFKKENEEEYIKELRNFINKFETILDDKKGRKSYKKKQ